MQNENNGLQPANFDQHNVSTTNQQQKQYEKRKPNLEVFQSTSKDGKYFITKTVITSIVPINYVKTILLNSEQEQNQ